MCSPEHLGTAGQQLVWSLQRCRRGACHHILLPQLLPTVPYIPGGTGLSIRRTTSLNLHEQCELEVLQLLIQVGVWTGEGARSYECPTCSAPIRADQIFSDTAMLASKTRSMPGSNAAIQVESVQSWSSANAPPASSKIEKLLAFLADVQHSTTSSSSG